MTVKITNNSQTTTILNNKTPTNISSGTQGLSGPPGMVWEGPWDSSITYSVTDVVQYLGSSYIAIASNTNNPPPSMNWNLVAAKGANGSGGGVESVIGDAPIEVDNTDPLNPVISITEAGSTTDGYLSSSDWNAFDSKQPAGNYALDDLSNLTAITGSIIPSSNGNLDLGSQSNPFQSIGVTAILLTDPTTGNSVNIVPPTGIPASYELLYPTTNPGFAGNIQIFDASGNSTWANEATFAAPIYPNQQMVYGDGSTPGGITSTNIETNGSDLILLSGNVDLQDTFAVNFFDSKVFSGTYSGGVFGGTHGLLAQVGASVSTNFAVLNSGGVPIFEINGADGQPAFQFFQSPEAYTAQNGIIVSNSSGVLSAVNSIPSSFIADGNAGDIAFYASDGSLSPGTSDLTWDATARDFSVNNNAPTSLQNMVFSLSNTQGIIRIVEEVASSGGFALYGSTSTGSPGGPVGVEVDLFNNRYSFGNTADNNSLTIDDATFASQLVTTDNSTFLAKLDTSATAISLNYNNLAGTQSVVVAGPTQAQSLITDGVSTTQMTVSPQTGFFGSPTDAAGFYYYGDMSAGNTGSELGVIVDRSSGGAKYILGGLAQPSYFLLDQGGDNANFNVGDGNNNSVLNLQPTSYTLSTTLVSGFNAQLTFQEQLGDSTMAISLSSTDNTTYDSVITANSGGVNVMYETLVGSGGLQTGTSATVVNFTDDSIADQLQFDDTGITGSVSNSTAGVTNNFTLAIGSFNSVITDGSTYQSNLNIGGLSVGMEYQNLTTGLNGTFNINNSIGTYEIVTGNTDIFYQITPDTNLHYAFEDFASGIVSSGTLDITQNTLELTDNVNYDAKISLTSASTTTSYTNIATGSADTFTQTGAATTIEHNDLTTNRNNTLSMDGSQASNSFSNLTTGANAFWQFSDDGSTGNEQLFIGTSDVADGITSSILLKTTENTSELTDGVTYDVFNTLTSGLNKAEFHDLGTGIITRSTLNALGFQLSMQDSPNMRFAIMSGASGSFPGLNINFEDDAAQTFSSIELNSIHSSLQFENSSTLAKTGFTITDGNISGDATFGMLYSVTDGLTYDNSINIGAFGMSLISQNLSATGTTSMTMNMGLPFGISSFDASNEFDLSCDDSQLHIFYTTSSGVQGVLCDHTTTILGTVVGGNHTTITIDDLHQLIKLANVPAFANDAAATGAGLTTGELYKTTTLGTTALNIVP